MYHAIILDQSLKDSESFLADYEPFNIKIFPDSGWIVNGLEIKDEDVDGFAKRLQSNMKDGPWYNHMYNEKNEMVVIFKEKVFKILSPDQIMEVWEFGASLEIPEDQLDFMPASFEEEEEYFSTQQ